MKPFRKNSRRNCSLPHILPSERVRVSLLYRQGVATQFTGVLNAGIYVFLAKEVVSRLELGLWLGAYLFIFVTRLAYQRWAVRTQIDSGRLFNPKTLEHVFVFGTFASGCAWGVAGFLLFSGHSIMHQAFLGFLLAGTTAAAAVAYSASPWASQAFLLPALLPLTAVLALEQTVFQHCMAVMLALYVILLWVLTYRMNQTTLESIRLRFEKDGLLEELREAQEKVTRSVKMAALGEMAAEIAHEINNPLGIIQGTTDNLQDLVESSELTQEEARPLIAQIRTTVARMATIISGLRAFSRQNKSDPMTSVSLHEIVAETLGFCEMRFRNHGVRLESAVQEELTLNCRSTQISQVLLNLLNNAFDAAHGQTDAWVRIEAREQGESIVLSVTDCGHGIKEPVRSQIMQPFFTTKEIGKGTGLGLSISRGIIERHGGNLRLDEACANTRFEITLPKTLQTGGTPS